MVIEPRNSDNVTSPACNDEELDLEEDSPSETGKEVSARVDREGFDEGEMICRPQFRRVL